MIRNETIGIRTTRIRMTFHMRLTDFTRIIRWAITLYSVTFSGMQVPPFKHGALQQTVQFGSAEAFSR
uniref:Uncharacterized protein n=1 Tax=Ascaris lumbricoides TaxID=6252 RepID=A0A0M3ILQ8_ASCLU